MSTAYYGRAVPLALRRFVRLSCERHGTQSQKAGQLVLPSGLPSGVHVVFLLNRRRQIEYADSWLGVREAWERILQDRNLGRKGEMQMYICCLLPRFWPLRWIWRWRITQWQDLLQEEGVPSVHLLSTAEWRKNGFHDQLQIPND